jgi:serine protease inhibitor ecotin
MNANAVLSSCYLDMGTCRESLAERLFQQTFHGPGYQLWHMACVCTHPNDHVDCPGHKSRQQHQQQLEDAIDALELQPVGER